MSFQSAPKSESLRFGEPAKPMSTLWSIWFDKLTSLLTSSSSAKYLLQTANTDLPNAQVMGSLATGLVKNTTITGVQSIAVAADFPTLNQNTTGTAANIAYTGSTTTTAGNGGAGALPATPEGFIIVPVGGVNKKIPYYPVS